MKKVITFFIIIAMLIVILPVNVSEAKYSGIDTNVQIGKTDKDSFTINITERILGRVQVVGSVISVAALAIIGLRYMFSTVEEKANMKGVLIYYIVGAVLVFATSNVLSIAYNILFVKLTM